MLIENPHIRSCAISNDSDFFFFSFNGQFFLFTFEKNHVLQFFSKVNKKIWQVKKQNDHSNCWTILLLVMWRFLNYTEIYYFS